MNDKFICQVCKKGFTSQGRLDNHSKRNHKIRDNNSWVCSITRESCNFNLKCEKCLIKEKDDLKQKIVRSEQIERDGVYIPKCNIHIKEPASIILRHSLSFHWICPECALRRAIFFGYDNCKKKKRLRDKVKLYKNDLPDSEFLIDHIYSCQNCLEKLIKKRDLEEEEKRKKHKSFCVDCEKHTPSIKIIIKEHYTPSKVKIEDYTYWKCEYCKCLK